MCKPSRPQCRSMQVRSGPPTCMIVSSDTTIYSRCYSSTFRYSKTVTPRSSYHRARSQTNSSSARYASDVFEPFMASNLESYLTQGSTLRSRGSGTNSKHAWRFGTSERKSTTRGRPMQHRAEPRPTRCIGHAVGHDEDVECVVHYSRRPLSVDSLRSV